MKSNLKVKSEDVSKNQRNILIVFQTIVLYPTPNIVTCTLRIWLREIGFALAYGALMLKTWR